MRNIVRSCSLACMVLVLCQLPASGRTIRVDPQGGGDALTIREGISLTADGDTLFITSGTYHENGLVADRSILIVGEAPDWPIIDGDGQSDIFSFPPPHGPSFRQLVLRNAMYGILGRLDGFNCNGPQSDWSADRLVLENMSNVGIDADNQACTVGRATWTNITAIDCAIGFGVNDYGTVVASNLVALRCAIGVDGYHYYSASFDCVLVWEVGTPSGGPSPIAIQHLLTADPMFCDSLGGGFAAGPGSPCLPENNDCGVLLGARSDRAPILAAVADYVLFEADTLVVDLEASDEDLDPLTYSTDAADVLPTPFEFDPATGVLRWVPGPGGAGEYDLAFEVTDGCASASDTAHITVHPGSAGVSQGGAPTAACVLSIAQTPCLGRSLPVLQCAWSAPGLVRLEILDVAGRTIRSLAADRVPGPGAKAITWDGRDGRGRLVETGAYLAVLRAGRSMSVRSIILIR